MSGFSPSLETERYIIIAACSSISRQEKSDRLRQLLCQPIRWQLLLDLADHHGVLPLLCQSLAGVHESIPPDNLSALMRRYQTNLQKTLLLSRELIRIVGRLSELGIR